MEGKDKKVKGTGIYERYFKRTLDLILAIFLLIILLPFMILLYIIIKLKDMSAPAIFKQTRCGRNNKPFELYKFRSMKASAPKNMATMEFENAEEYITRLGKFIRKTSIDELPQLVNIIKGEMSFVGPRPLIFEENNVLEIRDRLGVNQVLPGITGNAQINGRDFIGIEEKVRCDAEYSKNISLKLDIKLLFMTIPIVVFCKGNKDNEPVDLDETSKIYKLSENSERASDLGLDVANR